MFVPFEIFSLGNSSIRPSIGLELIPFLRWLFVLFIIAVVVCLNHNRIFVRLTLQLWTMNDTKRFIELHGHCYNFPTKSNVWLDILLLLSLRLWLSTTIAATIEAKIKKHDYLFVMAWHNNRRCVVTYILYEQCITQLRWVMKSVASNKKRDKKKRNRTDRSGHKMRCV